MIKGKKRASEKVTKGDEPIKAKTAKLETNKPQIKNKPAGSPKEKPTKFNKTTKKPGVAGGPGAKFAGKGKFTPKPGFKNKNNKFAGKPNAAKAGDKNMGAPEKTDWRKFKQDKKELKLKRKQTKDSYDIAIEAKKIYEKLKCRRTERKSELVEKLYNLLSADNLLKKIVMAHDTARIIQCMLKFAAPPLREQLSEKLLPLSVEMSISKYSHFCVLRMFKYGSPNIKSKLVDSFFGHIVKLASHNISSKILDHVYLTVANAKQKINMRQEFYGDLYKRSKDANVKELADAYKETQNMKASILSSVKSNLDHIANKQLVDNSLVHAVMLEYLRECDEEKVEETVTMYATLIPLMLSTKDGCQAAIICFYKATPKNRRAIIKTIKEHLVKICTHEHGHIFILAVLNSLDDTKATKKAIYDNIHPHLQALMANQWGRRVIEWLIAPGDTNCFHPSFNAIMEDGLQYGKKDKELRRKEIFEQVEEPIASAIAEQPEFWLSDRHIALVTADIMNKLSAPNFEKAANALASVICNAAWSVAVEAEGAGKDKVKKAPQDIEKVIAAATQLKKKKLAAGKSEEPTKENNEDVEKNSEDDDDDEEEDDEEDEGGDGEEKKVEEKENIPTIAGIEEAGLHIALKKIIKNDKERLTQNAEAVTFGAILVQNLNAETLEFWLSFNRGCFILLNIVENNSDVTLQELKKLIKPQLAALKKQSSSGGKLLLKKLT